MIFGVRGFVKFCVSEDLWNIKCQEICEIFGVREFMDF
jgi:hypothetical protein